MSEQRKDADALTQCQFVDISAGLERIIGRIKSSWIFAVIAVGIGRQVNQAR